MFLFFLSPSQKEQRFEWKSAQEAAISGPRAVCQGERFDFGSTDRTGRRVVLFRNAVGLPADADGNSREVSGGDDASSGQTDGGDGQPGQCGLNALRSPEADASLLGSPQPPRPVCLHPYMFLNEA